ncbi:hypothetical protein [Desulfobaculum bizertense]|uniref:Uncharacterized protein n=1 Tax=Desulfobaculum bizertense DSM 18034 TaxID=1121442 RepID=A0A1T4VK34_9BACT|nr:hypothetical protein [Desulfobaculum bizertense]SKA64931.1 hypothetical protein SAMN02745702_00427 [Desulfobaculum bizertense DSM 18034]
MKAMLSSPSALFFELVAFPERVFFCLFCRTYFLSERERSERKWWQHTGKRKSFFTPFSPKFEFHSREAWMEFKLDEDT